MKNSTKAALGAGAVVLAAGVALTVIVPFVGLIAGAYAVGSWAAASGMGTLGVLAMGGAGAIGGLIVGRIAGVAIMLGSVAAAAGVAGVTKLAGAITGGIFGKTKDVAQTVTHVQVHKPDLHALQSRIFRSSTKVGFNAAAANDNAVKAPAAQPRFKIGGFKL